MNFSKKNGKSLRVLYIVNILIIVAIVLFNSYIRSITVIQVSYDQGKKSIVELKKYAELFPLLTKISIAIFFIILLLSFLATVKANNYNKKRLAELTRLFDSVGFDKIDSTNSILDKNDIIIVETWNRSVAEVERINQKREKFFNQMIHDLNTPIQILKMNAKMNILKDDKRYAHAIEEELKELECRISNFLHIEKISYFEKPDLKLVNMQKYLKEIEDRFKILSIDMKINFSNDDITYTTDKVMYGKILQNLIENAVKYGKGKSITINVMNDKLEMINELKDGVSIGNIFADKNRRYSQNGNGLGVVIIQTYANLLNLEIKSMTIEDKFVVTIKHKSN